MDQKSAETAQADKTTYAILTICLIGGAAVLMLFPKQELKRTMALEKASESPYLVTDSKLDKVKEEKANEF